jgi:hypothetical protein
MLNMLHPTNLVDDGIHGFERVKGDEAKALVLARIMQGAWQLQQRNKQRRHKEISRACTVFLLSCKTAIAFCGIC